MAAVIDISIVKSFSNIFTFILVFVIIYGILEMVKFFGDDKKSIHAMIAIVVAFLVSVSNGVVAVVQTFTPWFAIIILIIFFILFAVKMFGVTNDEITKAFHNNQSILTWIIMITAIILMFSLGAGFGQETLDQGQKGGTTVSVATGNVTSPTDTGSFSQNLYNTLYHPKILGFILIMLIIVVALMFLTDADKV
jgi:hypothetical protein